MDNLFEEEGLETDVNPAGQLPVDSNQEDKKESKEELTDIQKELEAKFDELFGSMDD